MLFPFSINRAAVCVMFFSEGARRTTIKAATIANDKRHRKTTHNIRCFVVRLQYIYYIYILQSIRTFFPLEKSQNTSYAFFCGESHNKANPKLIIYIILCVVRVMTICGE